MKCINKLLGICAAAGVCSLVLGGCTSREDLTNAYSIYETSKSYALAGSITSDSTPSLLAADLCVGGTVNTASESVNSDYAASAAVFSVSDETVTYAQNIYDRMYPASTTKILTAYLALKYGDPDELLTVSEEAITSLEDSGSSTCGLAVGDQLTLEQALYGLLLVSGNDAANVIAEAISGSNEAFADLMNQEAAALGATQSHFINPHGLTNEEHYTTAYDLYLIFNAAVQDERFTRIISTVSYDASYTGADGNPVEQTWKNSNQYLKGKYAFPDGITVVGGKTGTTNAAGSCLVLYSTNTDGDPLISVVLKGNSRDELYTLMSQILTNYGG